MRMLALSGAMRGLHLVGLTVIMLAVIFHLAPGTNAAPWNQQPHDQADTESMPAEQISKPRTTNNRGCVSQAADVARAAAKTCGTLPIEDFCFCDFICVSPYFGIRIWICISFLNSRCFTHLMFPTNFP